MLFGFFVGCVAGSLLTAVALLLAIGVTSQRGDSRYQPMHVAPRAPTEIPQAAINPIPNCPVCEKPMEGRIIRWDRAGPTGFFCMEHGSERVDIVDGVITHWARDA